MLAQVVALLVAAAAALAHVHLDGTVHVVQVHAQGLGRAEALAARAALVRLAGHRHPPGT